MKSCNWEVLILYSSKHTSPDCDFFQPLYARSSNPFLLQIITSFNTLLKGLNVVGKFAEAKTLFKKVLNLKTCERSDIIIFTMISGLCKAGQTVTALEALQVFENAGLQT